MLNSPQGISTVCRCLLHSLSAVSGDVRHSFVPPGDFTWTVHQSGRGQCMEGHLPFIWRYPYNDFYDRRIDLASPDAVAYLNHAVFSFLLSEAG